MFRFIARFIATLMFASVIFGFIGGYILTHTHAYVYLAAAAVVIAFMRTLRRRSKRMPQLHPEIDRNPIAYTAFWGKPWPHDEHTRVVEPTKAAHERFIKNYGPDHPVVRAHAAALAHQAEQQIFAAGDPLPQVAPVALPQAAPDEEPAAAIAEHMVTRILDDSGDGYLGAAAALAGHPAITHVAVQFRGEIQGWVTAGDWQPTPDFAQIDKDDPVYQTVAWMASYAQEILNGFIPAPYRHRNAIAYAALKMMQTKEMPLELLERPILNPDATAEMFGLPIELLAPDVLQQLRKAIADQDSGDSAAINQQ